MSLHQISDLNEAIQKTNEWLAAVEDLAGIKDTNRNRAYGMTRAVLHALRDRLPVEEANDLAAQLPLVLKGVYFDGYKPAGKPIKFKTKEEFLERVMGQFPEAMSMEEAENATDAVLTVLEATVTEGEIADVRNNMPQKLKDLFE
jgi:uncharacterized protein (DUF2267 family)